MKLAVTDHTVIRQMASEGATDQQIAVAVGVSSQTILRFKRANSIAAGWSYPGRTHGLASTYAAGCRCDDCTAANRVRCREYYRAHLSLAARVASESHDEENGVQR